MRQSPGFSSVNCWLARQVLSVRSLRKKDPSILQEVWSERFIDRAVEIPKPNAENEVTSSPRIGHSVVGAGRDTISLPDQNLHGRNPYSNSGRVVRISTRPERRGNRHAANDQRAAHGEAATAKVFSPSPELKKLRREVVNAIHPDRASSESDRLLRERLTKEANAAYLREDADALRKILEEYRSRPESVKGEGASADLERIIRMILQISRRLAQIEIEIAELTSSEIALLMAKIETATAKGRNVLGDMAKEVRQRIGAARAAYESSLMERASR